MPVHQLRFFILNIFLLVTSAVFASKQPGSTNGSHLLFVENKGQWHSNVLFRAELPSCAVFFEKDGITFNLAEAESPSHTHQYKKNSEGVKVSSKGHAYKVVFGTSSFGKLPSGLFPMPQDYNYFYGKDKSKWVRNAKGFTRIVYENLWKGIDLVFYSKNGNLKYDLIIHPGADPSTIKFIYEGLDKIAIKSGKLILKTSVSEIQELYPLAFTEKMDSLSDVKCHYRLENNVLSFDLPEGYDRNAKLVIDPELIFSTYSGSLADNFGYTATYDSKGFLYSGSIVFGIGYPTTLGAYDINFKGSDVDIAISKYDTSGTFMVYSTYIGGSGNELPHSMIVNENDELYVFGTTGSVDFPVTDNAFQKEFANQLNENSVNKVRILEGFGVYFPDGTDIVVFKLNQDGTDLKSSTYLGGSDNDGLNSILESQLKITTHPSYEELYYKGGGWTFVNGKWETDNIVMEPATADTLKYNYGDEVRGEIDVDGEGNIYLATCTNSKDFPGTGKSVQSKYGGGRLDGIVIKLDGNLRNVLWSSYLGGNAADAIYSLALDSSNNIYVAGGTASRNFPVTASALQRTHNGGRSDGFVTYISRDGGKILSSSYYGTSEYDQIYFVERDYKNHVYVTGQTEADGNAFIKDAKYAIPGSGQFISKFTPDLDTLNWSTAIGTGSGNPDISPSAFLVDVCRKIYLSGWGGATNRSLEILNNHAGFTRGLPVTSDAFQPTTDGSDFWIMVLEDDASSLYYATFIGGGISHEHVDGGTSRFDRKGRIYQSVCAGCVVCIRNDCRPRSDFPIKPFNAVSPTNRSSNCNNAVFKFDLKLPMVKADFVTPDPGCAPYIVDFTNTSLEYKNTTYLWDFGDGTALAETKKPTHVYTKAGRYKVKLKLVDNLSCNLVDSIAKEFLVLSDSSYSLPSVELCPGQTSHIGIAPTAFDSITYRWVPSRYLSDPVVSNPVSSPEENVEYIVYVSNGVCTDTITQEVNLNPVDIANVNDTTICMSTSSLRINAAAGGKGVNYHWSDFPDFRNKLNPNPSDSFLVVSPPLPSHIYYLKAVNKYGCQDSDTINVSYSLFEIDLGNPEKICTNGSVLLKAETKQGAVSDYLWEPAQFIEGNSGGATVKAKPVRTTTYILTAINEWNCESTDSVKVEVFADTTYSLPLINLCPGKSASIGLAPVDSLIYKWHPGKYLSDSLVANPVTTPAKDIDYTVFVSNGVCTDTISQHITIWPILINDRIGDSIICSNAPPVKLVAKAAGIGLNYHWSGYSDFRNRLNSDSQDPTTTVNPLQAVNYYYLKVTNAYGCSDIDTVKILISDYNIRTVPDQLICSGSPVTLKAYSLIGEDGLKYSWQPVKYIQGRNDTAVIIARPVKPVTYVVTVTNPYGCIYKDSVFVDVSEANLLKILAWADKDTIMESQSTWLHVRPDKGYIYTWSPITSLDNYQSTDPKASPKVTTKYTVSVGDSRVACRVDTSVTVYVMPVICDEPNVFVPNAFTPNNDGNNDILLVRGAGLEKVHLIIYDRWGEKMFETFDVLKGWDGKYNNKDLDPAVFVYYLEVTCLGGKTYFKKGNVTLLR